MKAVALKRVATITAGQSPPSTEVLEYDEEGTPFLQGNAEFGALHPRARYRCDSTSKRALAGDILISIRAPVGALNRADRVYGIGRGLASVRPGPELDADFAWWFLHSAIPTLQAEATGSTYDAVAAEDIGTLRIPALDLSEQRAIADYLETETARIDGLAATKRKLLALLDERASRCLNDLFGLTFDLTADGVPVSVPGFEMARLGYLARVQTGLTLDAGREVAANRRPIAYLRVANVQDGRLDLDQIKTVTVPPQLEQRCLLQVGDVLMTEGGDPDKLGRGAVWNGEVAPCLHQNHVFAVRPDTSRLLPDYLAVVTRTAYARRYFEVTCSKTTGIASTSASKISAFRVPLCSVDRQREVVRDYSARSGAIDEVRSRLLLQLEALAEYRQALITAAVTGELEIPGAA